MPLPAHLRPRPRAGTVPEPSPELAAERARATSTVMGMTPVPKVNAESLPAECVLFGEDATQVVVSCDPEKVERIQQIAVKYGVSTLTVGATVPENLTIAVDGRTVVSAAVSELKASWSGSLQRALHLETEERLVPGVLQRS